MYTGAEQYKALYVRTRILKWILNMTGSQCKEDRMGVNLLDLVNSLCQYHNMAFKLKWMKLTHTYSILPNWCTYAYSHYIHSHIPIHLYYCPYCPVEYSYLYHWLYCTYQLYSVYTVFLSYFLLFILHVLLLSVLVLLSLSYIYYILLLIPALPTVTVAHGHSCTVHTKIWTSQHPPEKEEQFIKLGCKVQEPLKQVKS